MKFFFLILSFAMLYMSCLPCGDSQECNVKMEAKISPTDNHQQHNHDAEACTPFCTCSCCAATVFFTPISKAPSTHIAFQSNKYSLFDVAFNSEVFSSIWQPPQLS
ncbi:MAG: DUF6660 family protein [Chitinophagaceae bacterium]